MIANTGASGGSTGRSGDTQDVLGLVTGHDGTVHDVVVLAASPGWIVPAIRVVGAVLGILLLVAAIRAIGGKRR
jgi:hypothetical protein